MIIIMIIIIRKGLGSPLVDVSVRKDNMAVFVRKFFGILVGRCGSVVLRERD